MAVQETHTPERSTPESYALLPQDWSDIAKRLQEPLPEPSVELNPPSGDRVYRYALGVEQGIFSGQLAEHRQYLGAHDWDKVASLYYPSTTRIQLSEADQKRRDKIADYAMFEIPAQYTLDDYFQNVLYRNNTLSQTTNSELYYNTVQGEWFHHTWTDDYYDMDFESSSDGVHWSTSSTYVPAEHHTQPVGDEVGPLKAFYPLEPEDLPPGASLSQLPKAELDQLLLAAATSNPDVIKGRLTQQHNRLFTSDPIIRNLLSPGLDQTSIDLIQRQYSDMYKFHFGISPNIQYQEEKHSIGMYYPLKYLAMYMNAPPGETIKTPTHFVLKPLPEAHSK